MQFSEQWLRQYVNPALDSSALGHALTMAGLEVEGRAQVAASFSKVVVAEIVSAEKHPDADRLQVCNVRVGGDEMLQIVCGAPNARAGLKAPCALVGAELPGFNIKQAKVRGIESFGMMCSAKELGLAEESNGLLELPADAPVGQSIRDYLELNDQIFTLKMTPNRSDCLSVVGVAREVSALTGSPLRLPEIQRVDTAGHEQKSVRVEQPRACPYYAGRLIRGVDAQAETPAWMMRRLERSGVRGISAVVDITNYVLLEMGQPLHAFDAAKLRGDIVVRFAKPEESLALLNQQQVQLHGDMLVIADSSGPIALAGIMGGVSTAVSDSTVDIFLESAFFAPEVIIGRARRLGFSTDSSYRFERGVDYHNARLALERATALIIEICGGIASAATEAAAELPERKPIRLRMHRLLSVTGVELSEDEVSKLFDRLGFVYQSVAGMFEVTPPSYRFDISMEEDLIEEIIRLHGYDNVPALAPQGTLQMLPSGESLRGRAWLSDLLVAAGYQEVVNYSFVDDRWEHELLGNLNPVALKNPIASNMGVMRSCLWGGLLETLAYNLNRKQDRVRIFEIGAAYFSEKNGYREMLRISGLAYGDAVPEQWGEGSRDVDFYDVKAVVEALTAGRANYVIAQHHALHPGQSAEVMMEGEAIGWIGRLHPRWQQQYQFPQGVFLFELSAPSLFKCNLPVYAEVPKFPPVRRDLAVVVDEHVPVQALVDTMQAAKIPVIGEIALFDVYRGKGVRENQKSLAFRVLMQDTQKTLTDAEADAAMAKLLELIQHQHGAQLRT